MRIVAGRTKAACRVVFIKSGVHSLGDKGHVRFWHKADIGTLRSHVRFRENSGHWGMSALPPKADITKSYRHVCCTGGEALGALSCTRLIDDGSWGACPLSNA